MKQKQIILILIVFFLNILGRTWKDIPKYYKALGYVTVTNSLYYYICKRYLLWEFSSQGFHWKVLRGVNIFFVTPLITLLYLSKSPKPFNISYLLKWVTSSTLVEYVASKNKMIKYKHGWNIYWTAFLYLKMYLYSYLYTRKPNFTWLLSAISTIFFIKVFNVPLTTRWAKGPVYFLKIKDNKLFPFEFKLFK